ncbi:MAG: hypothetical protein ABSA93_24010 [Streptosporangiaceae bacterium]|jgi:hypothetical protein
MRRILWALSAATMLAVTTFGAAADAATVHVAHPRDVHARHGWHGRHVDPLSVIYLGPDFTQSSVRLTPGQLLLVSVQADVTATVADPAPGSSVEGGQLGATTYLFAAVKPGITTLSASVRPKCAPSTACPQWIAMPKLTVTVAG